MKSDKAWQRSTRLLLMVTVFNTLLITEVGAQPVMLPLKDLIDRVDKQSPVLDVLGTQILAQQQSLDAAKAKGGLAIRLQLSPGYGSGEPTSFFALNGVLDPAEPDVFAEGSYVTGIVSASYPLYKGGEVLGKDVASIGEAQARLDFSAATWQQKKVYITNLLARGYIDALQSKEQAEIYSEITSTRKKQIELIRRKVETRTVTESEILALQYALAKAEEGHKRNKLAYDSALREITDIAGFDPDVQLQLVSLADEIPFMPERDKIVKHALEKRSEIIAQQAMIDMAQSQVTKFESDKYPEVSLSLMKIFAAGDSNLESRSFSLVAINASYEFGVQNYTSKSVSAARSSLGYQEQSLTLMKTEIRREVLLSLDELLNSIELVKVAEADLKRMQFEVRTSNEKYKSGFISVSEAIDKENELLNAKLSLVESRFDRWRLFADIQKNSGLPFSFEQYGTSR